MRAGESIAWATVMLVVCSLVSKLAFLAQEGAIAATLGASRSVDVLLTARLVPAIIAGTLGSSLAVIVIPLFHTAVRDRGEIGPKVLLRHVVAASASIFAVAFCAIAPFSIALTRAIAPGYGVSDTYLSASLMLWAFPISFLECIALVLVGFLQAEKRFTAGAIASMANAAVSIPVVVGLLGTMGIWAVVVGWGLGALTQTLLLAWILRGHLGGVHMVDRGLSSGIVGWGAPVLLGTILGNLVPLTERSVASALGPGSLAVVNWAQKIMNLPLGLLLLPMTTAIYPYLAGAVVPDDADGLKARMRRSLLVGLFLLVPTSCILVMLNYQIVAALFMRGAFDALDVARTGGLVTYYGAGLVFIGGFFVASRIAYSLGDPWGPCLATGISSVLYVPIAIGLTGTMGVAGLALAYAVCMLAACVILGIRMSLSGKTPLDGSEWLEITRLGIAGLMMAASIWCLREVWASGYRSGVSAILVLLAIILVSVTVYVTICRFLRSEALVAVAQRSRWLKA